MGVRDVSPIFFPFLFQIFCHWVIAEILIQGTIESWGKQLREGFHRGVDVQGASASRLMRGQQHLPLSVLAALHLLSYFRRQMYDFGHCPSSKHLYAGKKGKGGCIQPEAAKFILSYPKELQKQEGVATYFSCKEWDAEF